jgi:hypothetical protein
MQGQPLLPVGEIRNVVSPRMVSHELQRMRGHQGSAWQHRRHEEARLRERQGRRVFEKGTEKGTGHLSEAN